MYINPLTQLPKHTPQTKPKPKKTPPPQQVAAKAQEKTAELSSLQRQQAADKAEEGVQARELQTHEEAAVRVLCVVFCVYCMCVSQ